MSEINCEQKTTDAEEIMHLLECIRSQAEILRMNTADKLACVITPRPIGKERLDDPHPLMSPIFYEMYKILKNIEQSLDGTNQDVYEAQLPVRRGEIGCSE